MRQTRLAATAIVTILAGCAPPKPSLVNMHAPPMNFSAASQPPGRPVAHQTQAAAKPKTASDATAREQPTRGAVAAPPAPAPPTTNGAPRTLVQGPNTIRLVQATELPTPPRSDTGLPPGAGSESSKRELQPGAGDVFLPPPTVPPLPPGMEAWQNAEQQRAPQAPVTLAALEQTACARNPTLAQARAEVEIAFGGAIQAGLWPNPTLFYVQSLIGSKQSPGEFLGGEIQQEFVTADKLDLSRAKFLERTRAAEWQAMGQEYRVLNDVRIHFFKTLGLQELVLIQNEIVKNAEDQLVTAREMYNLGQMTRADIHLANQALQEARVALLALQNEYIQTWGMLTSLAGMDDVSLTPLSGKLENGLPQIQWDNALRRLLAESPQLKEAQANLRSDLIQLKREKVEPIPNVFVRTGAGQDFEVRPRQAVGDLRVFAQVPVYDWNQGRVRQAQGDLNRQQLEIRRIQLNLRQELFAVYSAYVTALQTARNLEQVVLPEARKAYEVRLDSYEDDRIAWIDVLDAELNYFAQRAAYVESLVQWRTSEVLIVGYLLHGGLIPPANVAQAGASAAATVQLPLAVRAQPGQQALGIGRSRGPAGGGRPGQSNRAGNQMGP